MPKYHQGKFTPKNPKKYNGDPTGIIFRSGWEREVFRTLDEHPDVLSWSSEEIVIWYVSPIDNKRHRYFPDIWFKRRATDGTIAEFLVEVKPDKQQQPPKAQKRITRKYINEVHTWGINSAKWDAAMAYCKSRGWQFMLVGERDLGLKF